MQFPSFFLSNFLSGIRLPNDLGADIHCPLYDLIPTFEIRELYPTAGSYTAPPFLAHFND